MASRRKILPGELTRAVATILNDGFLELLTSQDEFALTLGIPQSTLSEYLRGVKVLDMETFVLFCEAVDLDPQEVFAVALSFRAGA